MTKPLVGVRPPVETPLGHRMAVTLALGLLLIASGVAAHGAPEPRDLDTRVVVDGTTNGDYGGPQGILDEGGIDLLALDVREAAFMDGAPAIVLRVIAQNTSAAEGRTIGISFEAAGQAHNITLTQGAAWGGDARRVEGPVPVGDGHPYAVDVWLDATARGIGAGTTLDNILLTSRTGEDPADFMPGSWVRSGVVVPGGDADPVSYVSTGPARLLDVPSELSHEGTAFAINITVGDAVGMEQFVELFLDAPEDVDVRLSQSQLLLEANGTRTFTLTADVPPGTTRTVGVTFTSDLGGYERVPVTLTNTATPPPVEMPTIGVPTTSEPLDESEDAPGSPLLLVVLCIGALALARRRFA